MTDRWLSISDAAARLRRSDREVLALVFAGDLTSELRFDHYEVTASSVEEYAHRLTPRDPANPAEDVMTNSDDVDYFREQNT